MVQRFLSILFCLVIVMFCGTVINTVCSVSLLVLLVIRSYRRDFNNNTYTVTLSVTLFIVVCIGVVLHSYRVAHEFGNGIALASQHPQAACLARGIETWEIATTLSQICDPSQYFPRRIPGGLKLQPAPTHAVAITRGPNIKQIVPCELLGISCFSTDAVSDTGDYYTALPWNTVQHLRVPGASEIYVVVPDGAVHGTSHNIQIETSPGVHAWIWSRTRTAVRIRADGTLEDPLPTPRRNDIFVLIPRSGMTVEGVFLRISNRCSPDNCLVENSGGFSIPGAELYNLAKTTHITSFCILSLLSDTSDITNSLHGIVYVSNCVLAGIILCCLSRLCLRETGKSGTRLILCTFSGATFNWVGVGAGMLFTQRKRLSGMYTFLWSFLCIIQSLVCVFLIAECLHPERKIWLGRFNFMTFIILPSVIFHGNIFLINTTYNLLTSLVLAILGVNNILHEFNYI